MSNNNCWWCSIFKSLEYLGKPNRAREPSTCTRLQWSEGCRGRTSRRSIALLTRLSSPTRNRRTYHICTSLSLLEHLHRRTASVGCGHAAAAARGVFAVTAMAVMTHSSASRPSVDRIASSWPQPATVVSCGQKHNYYFTLFFFLRKVAYLGSRDFRIGIGDRQ